MSDVHSSKATLLRVDDSGRLIFRDELGHAFFIEVNDDLEQAIIEAKQIKTDRNGTPQPQNQKTIPIPEIQALVRAGQTPEHIAHDNGLSLALVRRFAAPVETEKRYAINQFLNAPIPGEIRKGKIYEIIRSTLSSSGIGIDTLQWRATRHNHDPWKIRAVFEANNRVIKAEWTWNLRDHSVVCVNTPAKKLLGENAASASSPIDHELFTNTDSSTSSFSALDMRGPLPPQWMSNASVTHADYQSAHRDNAVGSTSTSDSIQKFVSSPLTFEEENEAANADRLASSLPEDSNSSAASFSPTPAISASSSSSKAQKAESSLRKTVDNWLHGGSNNPEKDPKKYDASDNASGAKESPQLADSNSQDSTVTSETPSTKKRTHRSAVPKWEDILFGE